MIARLSTFESAAKRSRRVRRPMTTSSSEQFPARSPIPLTVHSTCRAPAGDGGERVGDGEAEVVVAMDGDPRLHRAFSAESRSMRLLISATRSANSPGMA